MTKETNFPLPKNGEFVMYDLPEGNLVSVMRKPDGTFYGDAGEFDFTAATEQQLIAKLAKWNARFAGWEH